MTPRLSLVRRALAALTRSRRDDELRQEIEQHIEHRRVRLIDEGMDPRDAAFEARRMFGNVAAIREETREMRSFTWLDTLAQDVRYGVRLLRKSPAFALTAAGSLALGIGAAAAVFSLADALLLRTLPVKDPQQLVLFRWVSGPRAAFESLNGNGSQTETEWSSTSFARTAYDTMRTELADAVDLFAFADLYRVNLAVRGTPDVAYGQAVSGNYFPVLGVTPAAGRLLTPADDRAGAPPAAVLGHDLWQRRFGGSHEAIGQLLVVNGMSFTIAGVMPRGFNGTLQVGQPYDVVVPMAHYRNVTHDESADNPNHWWVLMMGRLAPGATMERVAASGDQVLKRTVAAAKTELKPEELPRLKVEDGARGQTETREGLREPIRIMALVVAIVVLVACVNVANLLLARGRARARELAVRAAIGAPRRRLVRQLVTEGLLLGATACAVGLVIARWISDALLPALAVNTADGLQAPFGIDARILGFTCTLAVVCSVAFALLPALRSADSRITTGLQEGTRGAVGSRRRFGASGALVVVQVALSMLLVSAAGLLGWSAWKLQRIDPGFDPADLLTFSVDTSLNGYTPERSRAFFAETLERLRGIPGVTAASLSSHRLIANSSATTIAHPAGAVVPPPGTAEHLEFRRSNRAWRLAVDDTFLETMKIPLLRGRALSRADSAQAPKVCVVNAALAKQLFGSEDVVGRRIGATATANVEFEIVGVAANARYTSMRREPPPTFYVPYQQAPLARVTFEVRTAAAPAAIVPQVREAFRQLDSTLPLFDIRTQQEQILRSLEQERLFARLALLLGGVTLALSAIGLYGLLASAVSRRTAEIGVRMALGAERRQVRWMVLRQSLILVAAGLALGVPAAYASTTVVDSLLFGLSARDPKVFAGAAVVMTIVALAAAYIPARRASRIDPLSALRAE